MGLGWSGQINGVNHDPAVVKARREKTRTGIKLFRNGMGPILKRFLQLRLILIRKIPKNGVRVRQAQNAKRSYVNHSHAFPRKIRGSGVVPPSPNRNRMVNEIKSPLKRAGHLRISNGIIKVKGP